MSMPEKKGHQQSIAENLGQGNQYISHGVGDQNAVHDNGRLVKYNQQININLSGRKTGKMGIPPSVGQFFQRLGASDSWDQEPSERNIFEWLTTQPNQIPLNFSQHQRSLLVQVSQGTGKWIFDTTEFLEWREASNGSSRILWMQGILGSGKTMLLSLIIDSIEKRIKSRDDAACVYFFFQAEKHAIPLTRIWATLLTQLLKATSSNIASALKKKFNDPFKRSAVLDSSEYFDLFKAQVGTFKTVYLVIDALDSCQNAPREATLKGIQMALADLPHNVRILLTSRDNYIGKDVGATGELLITPKEADVKAYVKNRIAEDRRLRSVLVKSEHQEEIIQGVTTRAMSSKMFLSAKLHMDHLSKQGPTFFDITQALRRLPDSALGAFKTLTKQIAQKIKSNGRSGELLLTKHILLWVSHAKVDINIRLIQDSFAIQKSEGQCYQDHRPVRELVMRASTGLVKTENGTLGLVHKSVKNHLFQFEIIPNNADLEMGKTCLYFLINTCEAKGNSPLLQYAARYWWSHLNSNEQALDEKTDSLVMKLLRDGSNLAQAFKAMEEAEGDTFNGMTGWHAAVHFDLLSWAERFPPSVDIDAQCSDGQTALHWAVRYGRRKFVELLIRKSANSNLLDHVGDTPLHKALAGPATDNVAIIKALIKGNARLDIRNGKGVSALETVIQFGPTSIAKLMIESQEDVSAEIFEDWTLLRYIFSHGQEIFGVVNHSLQATHGEWNQLQAAVKDHFSFLTELILERGVDLNRPSTKDGWIPLVSAINKRDLPLMRRLLTREPDQARVDIQDSEGKTPLWWATHCGMADAIQLLVHHGAKVNEPCGDDSTPLYEAVKSKNSELVRLLVSLGANANTRTANASTMLIEAIRLQDRHTIWVLLNADAKPDGCDGSGKSALLYAIEGRDNDIVWQLISRGANVTGSSPSTKSSGTKAGMETQNPLELALRRSNHQAAWLLCESGASPHATIDNMGISTLLHLAVYSGDISAVRLLIQYGASTVVQGEGGLTPLHFAVLLSREDIVALLASQSADPISLDVTDAKGNTALSLATQKKDLATTRILIRYRASCNVADAMGLTTVHHAARLGFSEGLRILLDSGGDPNAIDKEGFTALHHVVSRSYSDLSLLKTLIAAGANLELGDGKKRRRPLMLAAQLGKDELVSTLIEAGADPRAHDGGGYTALHYAKNHSTQEILRARGGSQDIPASHNSQGPSTCS